MLQDGAVAQRPVLATARAGAGGAHQRSPQNDGDEIDQHGPGKPPQGTRGKPFGIDGDGGSGHEGKLRMQHPSVEQARGGGLSGGRVSQLSIVNRLDLEELSEKTTAGSSTTAR